MLKLEHIKKTYDKVTILNDINLQIEDGEIVSILGPSGCGKTTLLNLILGITQADSGKILYNGDDYTDIAVEKRGFNIVFQDYALFPNLNVYEKIYTSCCSASYAASNDYIWICNYLFFWKRRITNSIMRTSVIYNLWI